MIINVNSLSTKQGALELPDNEDVRVFVDDIAVVGSGGRVPHLCPGDVFGAVWTVLKPCVSAPPLVDKATLQQSPYCHRKNRACGVKRKPHRVLFQESVYSVYSE